MLNSQLVLLASCRTNAICHKEKGWEQILCVSFYIMTCKAATVKLFYPTELHRTES